MIYILTGVSGCGKTTIGSLLAERLHVTFLDADDYHPEANLAKMSAGTPLEDADRVPWLEAINRELRSKETEGVDLVIGCSALKYEYRDILGSGVRNIQWIQLEGPEELIESRITARAGHFFDPALLHDQVESVEFPVGGWHFSIQDSPEEIVERILDRIRSQEQLAEIGLVGLGVMGQNLVLNMADKGMRVAAYNRHVEGIEEDIARKFAVRHPEYITIAPFDNVAKFVSALKRPRKVLLMVKAGKAVDAVIDQLTAFMQAGDMIIDGGNSHYLDTERRSDALQKVGIQYVGMGISGGEFGARNGPSMMPGLTYSTPELSAILNAIAARDKDGEPCWTAIGPGGSGHFVKMIHNGIEYAEMQLIAECHLMLSRAGMNANEIAALFDSWRTGPLDSYLLEITSDILRKYVDDKPALELIDDIASHKGTGRWSVEAALEFAVPSNSIYAALFGRQASSQKDVRRKASIAYGDTHSVISTDQNVLAEAYQAARLINHIIGFEIIREASRQRDWNCDVSEIARIWTNGCIIRSGLMEQLHLQFKQEFPSSLLLHSFIVEQLSASLDKLRSVVSRMTSNGVAIPCFMSCLTYFDSMTSNPSSAHIIAAQRDYFGSHGFSPREEDGPDHINWITS